MGYLTFTLPSSKSEDIKPEPMTQGRGYIYDTEVPTCVVCLLTKSTSCRVILIFVQLFLQGGMFRLKQASKSLNDMKTSTRREAFVLQGYGFCLPPKFKLNHALYINISCILTLLIKRSV